MPKDNFKTTLNLKGLDLGFVALGVVSASLNTYLTQQQERLECMVAQGRHSIMGYLERNRDIRVEPANLLPGAKSIVVTLASYKPQIKQLQGRPGIASYAYGEDYHRVIKGKLLDLSNFIKEFYPNAKFRVFTDSAPIFERALAYKAGLGFIGKSNFLINPIHGLHTLIGVLITDVELDYSQNELIENKCGSCKRCIESCPTGALIEPFIMDARKCISCSTIESKELSYYKEGSLTRAGMIFGCDICLEVCPWSRKGSPTTLSQFYPLKLSDGREVIALEREEWLAMESESFKKELALSPMLRAGLEKIKNNIEYEMADSCRSCTN